MNPTVSIVLPVYNCPQYVGAAIESMLAQSFTDYEMVVIDDGSRDETLSVVRRYTDPRIHIYTQANQGLAATLNRGIELARGRYIARQDQDDISLPERLTAQVTYLEANRSCGLVGTWAEIWREGVKTEREHRHPSDDSSLKFELLLNNPFVHSSVMLRKAALDKVGGYSVDKGRQPPEDYELWSRIAREYEVANIPEALHRYREVAGSMSRDGSSPFLDHLVTISAENVAWASGEPLGNPQVINIAALAHGAKHRVAAEPDFRAMTQIFQRAAQRVVAPTVRAEFAHKAKDRVSVLRSVYRGRSQPARLLRRLIGIAGRTAGLIRRGD
jgi:glycosyltransferase involved in cell wall biosynthesis